MNARHAIRTLQLSAGLGALMLTTLCADVIVQTQQICEWRWHEPRTRCDFGC